MYTLSADQNTLSHWNSRGGQTAYRAVNDDNNWCSGCTFALQDCPSDDEALDGISSKCMPSFRKDARSIIWVKEA